MVLSEPTGYTSEGKEISFEGLEPNLLRYFLNYFYGTSKCLFAHNYAQRQNKNVQMKNWYSISDQIMYFLTYYILVIWKVDWCVQIIWMVSLIRASNILLLPYTAQVSSIHTALHGFKAILRNNHGNHHFAVYQNNRCIQGHPFMDNKEENAKCLTCSHLFKTLTLLPLVI